MFGIVRGPGVPAGTVTHALASTLDIYPTLASLSGSSLPSDRSYDGVDLSPVLLHGAPSVRDALFIPDVSGHTRGNLTAARYGNYSVYWQTNVSRCDHCQSVTLNLSRAVALLALKTWGLFNSSTFSPSIFAGRPRLPRPQRVACGGSQPPFGLRSERGPSPVHAHPASGGCAAGSDGSTRGEVGGHCIYAEDHRQLQRRRPRCLGVRLPLLP